MLNKFDCEMTDYLLILNTCQWFSHSHRLLDGMISNCITLSLKCQLYFWGIMDNQHTISIHVAIGIPIILNLYQMACNVSIPTFMVTNSAPNTDNSIVDCFLEYQLTSDIHICHEPGPRSFSLLVASMIAVYKHI